MGRRRKYAYSFEASIEEMTQLAYRVRFSYDIWWVMESRETRPRFLDAMNRYGDFFGYTIEAHFGYFMVGLFRFFDDRRDTLNFKALLERAAPAGVSSQVLAACRAELQSTSGIVTKIRTLRHEVFAHRAAFTAYDESFKSASLTPNEVVRLMDSILIALNTIRAALGGARATYPSNATLDTINLLETLRRPFDVE